MIVKQLINHMKKIFHLIFLLIVSQLTSQQTPGSLTEESILFIGATAHIGNATIIENSAIGIRNGEITEVSTENLAEGIYDQTIDVSGKHIYPGFIAANTSLGLVEIDAVRASNDVDEIGDMLPHIRSIIAYNAESKIIESMRPNGILIAQVTPRGGFISGKSSIVQLDAWNWEDAVIRYDDGIHLNWPNPYTRGRRWLGESPDLKVNKKYAENISKIEDFFENAMARSVNSKTKNLPYYSLNEAIKKNKTIFLHANDEKQIVDGIVFLKNIGIKNIVLVGGRGLESQLNVITNNNIPVILSHPHRLPSREDEDLKQPFKLASKLINEGVLVTIDVQGSMERMNTRNLPFYAGSFSAYGVEREEAVEMITLNAAKILGIDDEMGSLEEGKDATLFISEGDALDMMTNIISRAFIQGREISLETHQTKLWKRYSKKYSKE